MAQRRRRTRRPVRRAPAAAKDSTLPIVLTVVGIGLAAVLLFAIGRGGSEETAAAPVAEAPRKKKPDPHEDARNKASWWYDETFFDHRGRARPLSGKKIDALLAEGERRGYPAIPKMDWKERKKRVYRALLRREPYHPAANRAHGKIPLTDYPDFFAVFKRMTNHLALPPEFEDFRDEIEGKIKYRPYKLAPPLPQAEYEAAVRLLDRFQEWDRKLEENPTLKAILEARKRVKTDPLLGRYDTVHIEVPPFVIFYAAKEIKARNKTPLEKKRVAAEKKRFTERLESYRRLIQDYLAFFRKTWMKPLGLPEFEKDQLFFVWIFGDRNSWEEYGMTVGVFHPPGLLGYFNPRDHWVFLFEDKKDRITVENSLAHELTHQLHWHFSKDPESEFRNHFPRLKAVWFEEGWAEYAGWTSQTGGRYRFGQTAPARVRSLRLLQKYGVPLFPLKELVKRQDYREWLKTVLLEWLPKQRLKSNAKPEELAALFLELLYAQSWLLMSYLYEGKGGVYRAQALEFTKASLRGYKDHSGARGYARAHEVFAKIFRLRSDGDWKRFQKGYEAYMEEKFYEVK